MVPTTQKKGIPSAAQWNGSPLCTIKRAKGTMVLDLDLDSDLTRETELEKIRIQAWTKHRALHVHHHAPTYIQEQRAVVPVARRMTWSYTEY